MKKTDNRGLSLVELLIAVCILAIIAAPLLHSFVTSYHVNARSRQTMRATTLAQNEMEVFEREKLSDIAANPEEFGFKAPDSGILPMEPDADGCYKFEKIGVINDDSGRDMFDVYVTLDPERQAGEKYETQNTTELAGINTLSALDSGSYVQKVKTERNKKSDDRIMYENFATLAEINGQADKDAAYFRDNLERVIEIKIEQEDDGSGDDVTKATVTYTYTCPSGIIPAEQLPAPKVSMIYNNSQSMGEDGKKVPLKSVYLFYAPRYAALASGKQDKIIVDNAAGVPVNVYIVRQEVWESDENWTAGTPDTVKAVPANYQPILEIKDTLVDGRCSGTYYTNLKLDNVEEGAFTNIGAEAQIVINGTPLPASPAESNRKTYLESIGCMKLGSSQAKDRIYSMTVKVYEKGGDPDTDDPMITMRGTKLE